MSDKTIPVALLRRYTTLAGTTVFKTSPLHVVAYESAELVAWRGAIPVGATFEVSLEESVDRAAWNPFAIATPGEDEEVDMPVTLEKPWMRAVVTLEAGTSDYPIATCYLVGHLVRRRS